MILIWVIATLGLHQVAFFIELGQSAILSVATGGYLREYLHLLLVFPELELVGSQGRFFLSCELVCRLVVLHLFLVKSLKDGHLVLVHLLFSAQAQSR